MANGQIVGSFSAANFRQDLVNAGKGNGQHGFNFAPPASIKNGQNQSVSLRVQGSSFTLEQGPRTIQCAGSGSSDGTTTPPTNPGTTTPPPSNNPSNGNYEGNFEGADCGNLGGWVYDRNNPNAPITVEVVANGQVVGSFSAANFRQDLLNAGKGNGQHGFNFAPPESVKNGQNQSISLRVQGSSYTLNNSPKTIQCAGSGSSGGTGSNPGTNTPETGNCSVGNPKGHLDNATMYSVGGWALDENNLTKTVLVDIFVDGLKLATVEANEDRPDLVGAFGNNPAARYHGFSAEFGLSGAGNGIGTVTTRICGSTSDLPTSINSQVNFRSDFFINPDLIPITIDGGILKVFVLIKAKRPSEGDAGGPTGPAGPAVGIGGPSTAGGSGGTGTSYPINPSGPVNKPALYPVGRQCEVYKYMWDRTFSMHKEQLSLMTNQGIFLMPDTKNTVNLSHIEGYPGLTIKVTSSHSTLYLNGKELIIEGIVHTHPPTTIYPTGNGLSQGDLYVAQFYNAPIFAITQTGIYRGRPGEAAPGTLLFSNENESFNCSLTNSNLYLYK
ncbi:hypothetical protein [Larkinella sp.]|uniref:hypothetical protein n=1 Tax=Larkinella sp. TaxID=2034517 RepID=UPI003BABDE8B